MKALDQEIPALSINNTAALVHPVMHLLSSVLLLGSVAVQTVLGRPGAGRQSVALLKHSVDSFIKTEEPVALEKLLCNIGPDGCNANGAASGVVIASPSNDNPDYFYTWTRDSGLVFKSLVDRFINRYDAGLQRRIEEYIVAQAKLQAISNPSGSLSNGAGLGEPKFEANLEPFTGDWGRPQRDGPPLRAAAMITYATWLIENGYSSTASTVIWPIIQNDLNYVAQYWYAWITSRHDPADLSASWKGTRLDLTCGKKSMEVLSSQSLVNTGVSTVHNPIPEFRISYVLTIPSALVDGSNLAAALDKHATPYAAVASQVLCFLQSFWIQSSGYIDSNINVNDGREGKDANSLLASIHAFDPKLGCDSATFQPCSDKALSNHKVTVDSFRSYKINSGLGSGKAAAVGRYIEDVYFNGNPWYLTTLAAAEQLYDSLIVWQQMGCITVTDTSLAFFQDLVPDVSKKTYASDTSSYAEIVSAVSAYADGFFNIVAKYAGPDGSLDEQFSRDDGHPLSARDLTWSYASFLTAAARRAGVAPPTWSNNNATSIPSVCSATAALGSYSSATVTSFPPSQTPKAGVPPVTTTPRPCRTATTVAVTFRERAQTRFGQTIKIVGNVAALGHWDTKRAVALNSSDYTSTNPLWKTTVTLMAGQAIEYKYIKVDKDGSLIWEHDPNHTYTVPKTCATTAVRLDNWQS
ncbi:glucoamylase I precursor [Drechmeria coniospora]|uniref:glucan 1,4-alpha-glucosidase n=1 Tax=Drechmeria coniospora TaxID=98403 RepID=A0A151GF67_DRECN|nr:glucoamylase I precursor [Drechmeria coniospora]KYK55735.1 glucoamylase I precursor [Drechmeria coniospora]